MAQGEGEGSALMSIHGMSSFGVKQIYYTPAQTSAMNNAMND